MTDTIHPLGTSPRVLPAIDQPLLADYVALALDRQSSRQPRRSRQSEI